MAELTKYGVDIVFDQFRERRHVSQIIDLPSAEEQARLKERIMEAYEEQKRTILTESFDRCYDPETPWLS